MLDEIADDAGVCDAALRRSPPPARIEVIGAISLLSYLAFARKRG
jgi:hypothetical protein